MKISEWLAAARAYPKPKITQERLGELLGVSKQNVNAWEKGRHEPSYSQILKIRDLTGYPALPNDVQMHGWPMPMVDRARYENLSQEDRAYVQAKAMAAIEEREAASSSRKPPRASA